MCEYCGEYSQYLLWILRYLKITSGDCFWVQQSIGDIPRNIWLKIPRTTCCVIQIWCSMPCNLNRDPPRVFFCEVLEQLLSRIIFGVCFWKENRGRGRCKVTLVVAGFYFFQGIHLLSNEKIFFRHKFSHSGAFQFGLCHPFL